MHEGDHVVDSGVKALTASNPSTREGFKGTVVANKLAVARADRGLADTVLAGGRRETRVVAEELTSGTAIHATLDAVATKTVAARTSAAGVRGCQVEAARHDESEDRKNLPHGCCSSAPTNTDVLLAVALRARRGGHLPRLRIELGGERVVGRHRLLVRSGRLKHHHAIGVEGFPPVRYDVLKSEAYQTTDFDGVVGRLQHSEQPRAAMPPRPPLAFDERLYALAGHEAGRHTR